MRYAGAGTDLPLAAFADESGIVILPLLLIAGLVAVALSLLAPFVSADNRRTRLAYAVLALVIATATAWLVLYAMGWDMYYASGRSRWEHASRWGKAPIVGAAITIAAGTSIGLLVSALVPGRVGLRLLIAPAAAISSLLLLVGWFFLTAGH